MYINPFIAGILATIVAEVVIIIGIAVFSTIKQKQGGYHYA